MKPDVRNKLILQLLPAVASRNAGIRPTSKEELRQFWKDCLSEADALSELYEEHITTSKDAE